MARPLAYLITWGAYGTRLHGDPRGTVEREHNEFDTRVLGTDTFRWERERGLLKFPPVELTAEQCTFVEDAIPSICKRGQWTLLASSAAPDHVHVVLASTSDPQVIRQLLKGWLGQELSARWPLPRGATWWAECGSIRWAFDEAYQKNLVGYVSKQRRAREA